MFHGCSKDLSEIPLWTKAARVGYLAHIVASDPAGPRGSQADSHRLSDCSDNIMLMCDEHHRLIDSFAPHYYTADVLNEMRQSHRETVRYYLDSLAFPHTKAVTLHANLANVPTYFHDSELIEAIVATRRAMLPGVIHYIRRKSQRDDRHLPGFWHQYLREHENHIRQLIAGFESSNGLVTESLAVFPLHHIPTLVLAGRVMGRGAGHPNLSVRQSAKDMDVGLSGSAARPRHLQHFTIATGSCGRGPHYARANGSGG